MNAEQVGGLRFGRYQVVRPIGEGGMAQVYLAMRFGAGGFEKPVVLKVLHSRFLSNPTVVNMFLEEARVLARLRHPHIIDVFEVECVGGVPYLAMEHVAGPTLGDLQRFVGRPNRATIGFFLVLVRQICLALHHAHTLTVDGKPLGLIHRDVSSQNILVDAATGSAKLIDFGIAKATDSNQHTEVGVLKGKLHYMAPEVLRGSPPDARSDVYSVGVLLYRILLGRNPFREADLLRGDRSTPYLPVTDFNDPPGVGGIAARAMAAAWEDRIPTAGALADELQAVIEPLAVDSTKIVPFIAQVFPRGEEDWRRRATPGSRSPHSALAHLASESASLVPAPMPLPRTRRLVMFTAGTVGMAAFVVLVTVAVMLAEVFHPDRSGEAGVLLDLADELIVSHDPAAAQLANDRASRITDVDAQTTARAADQRVRIARALGTP